MPHNKDLIIYKLNGECVNYTELYGFNLEYDRDKNCYYILSFTGDRLNYIHDKLRNRIIVKTLITQNKTRNTISINVVRVLCSTLLGHPPINKKYSHYIEQKDGYKFNKTTLFWGRKGDGVIRNKYGERAWEIAEKYQDGLLTEIEILRHYNISSSSLSAILKYCNVKRNRQWNF